MRLSEWNRKSELTFLMYFSSLFLFSQLAFGQYQMEKLDRGVLAVRTGSNNFVSWRWLGTEDDMTFNLYRNGTKVNASPLTVCNYTDNGAAANASYTVKAVVGGVEQAASKAVTPWAQQYMKIPIQAPAGGTTPDGVAYTYNANDASVADLDGDGTWEIILKWDPSNSKDNSQSGYTGNTYVDAYKLDGTRMWRIDYGVNIRSGAHYMDFMVYDFDGDGKAEMMCRTGDGTKDGQGKVIGNATADYRTTAGYVLSGPEYFSVFNGQTGAVMATTDYLPARGTVASWGDSYGNRVDRFRAGVAYLDGKRPSGVFVRGYYTRTFLAAWDWRDGKLTSKWTFDSNVSANSTYYAQGDHSLSIADVDDDGKQEIIVGSAIVDDNGTPYYNTTFGHGDALHVSDLDPDLPGLEVFNIQERIDVEGAYMYSAKSKKVLWTKPTAEDGSQSEGPGRGVSADITADYKGAECWSVGGGVQGSPWNCKGVSLTTAQPVTCNFLAWWDGDLLRELLNNTMIDKYGTGRLLTAYNIVPISSNNGTKSTPCLSGDIFGDWREEVIWRATANDALYIFTTVTPSTYKFRTLMHDPQYRVAIAWQNTGYNQPPHLSYYLGDGMSTPPKPNITIVGGSATNVAPTTSITSPLNNASYSAPASITINATALDSDGSISKVEFYNGNTLLGSDNSTPYSYSWTNVAAGTYSLKTIATDDVGATGTSTIITVTVTSPNTPPTVSITSPSNNAVINGTPATIVLTANAADANGTISKVEFYRDTVLLGSDNTAPYSFSWTNVSAGTYSLTAVATDNGGASTTSSPIVISVLDLPTDCNGIQGGTATTDKCDRCVGGTTGKIACSDVFEAEEACAMDGVLESTNEGFNGTGYVNTNNAVGASVSYVILSSNAGNLTLGFRYANAGTDRTAQLTVNGTAIPGTIAFASTGTWIDWAVEEVTIPLLKGSNTVVLAATTTSGLANLDQVALVSTGLSEGSCGPVTGLEEEVKPLSFSLYPNPSSKDFHLILPEKADIKIMTAQGTVIESSHEADRLQFGGDYVPGIYMVQVTNNGSSQVYRIIKK